MKEIIEASKEKRLLESFGAGTAVVLNPISGFGYKSQEIDVPLNMEKGIGDYTKELSDFIQSVQYGEKEYKDWGEYIN